MTSPQNSHQRIILSRIMTWPQNSHQRIILSRIMTWPQNSHHRIYSKSNYDPIAKRSPTELISSLSI